MNTMEIIITVVLFLLLILMAWYYMKCKQKFVKMLFGICSGVLMLYPAQMILSNFDVAININVMTVSLSAILGIPGVILIVAFSLK